MKRIIYILLCLLPVVTSAQVSLPAFQAVQFVAPAAGGGSGYCGVGADSANAYIARVESFTGPQSSFKKNAVCTLYSSLISSHQYDSLYAAWILKWSNASANGVNLKSPNGALATNTGSPVLGDAGATYNGTTQSTNLGIAPSIAPQDRLAISVGVATAATTDGVSYMGAGSAFNAASVRFGRSDASFVYVNLNNPLVALPASGAGLYDLNRLGTNEVRVFKNGVDLSQNYTATSSTPLTYNMYLGGSNNNGTLSNPAAFTANFAAVHKSWNITIGAAFYTTINTFTSTW